MKKLLVSFAVALAVLAAPVGAASASRKPPASCVKALSLAEQAFSYSEESNTNVSTYFNTLHDSAVSAGSDALVFLRGFNAATNDLTAKTQVLTPKVDAVLASYRFAAARCRAGK